MLEQAPQLLDEHFVHPTAASADGGEDAGACSRPIAGAENAHSTAADQNALSGASVDEHWDLEQASVAALVWRR